MELQTCKLGQILTGYKTGFVRPGHNNAFGCECWVTIKISRNNLNVIVKQYPLFYYHTGESMK